MVTVLVIGRHTAESCAIFNERSQKLTAAWYSKKAELEAKHGVKELVAVAVTPEHLTVEVLQAPSFEALQAFFNEPENVAMASWQTMEMKVAETLEEIMQAMPK